MRPRAFNAAELEHTPSRRQPALAPRLGLVVGRESRGGLPEFGRGVGRAPSAGASGGTVERLGDVSVGTLGREREVSCALFDVFLYRMAEVRAMTPRRFG